MLIDGPVDLSRLGYVDVVDFVERTTYEIWNSFQPELVMDCYLPSTIIWADGGDLLGDIRVTGDTRDRQNQYPDYHGVIQDTIFTGDDQNGYRTSMRWISRGTPAGHLPGRPVVNSCIAHCVVLGGRYIEEWGGGNGKQLIDQLGGDLDEAARRLPPTTVPLGEAGWSRTRALGAMVPAIPATIDGAGQFVIDLLEGLYTHRDLDLIDRRYAPGAAYIYAAARWNFGAAGVRSEVQRWLNLLPDARISIQELYWNQDTPHRSRVAVRYQITGTAKGVDGKEKPVAIMCFHHIHLRGDLVVAEWVEYDELALHAQLL